MTWARAKEGNKTNTYTQTKDKTRKLVLIRQNKIPVRAITSTIIL
jgi:hypothetical protein